MASASSSPLLLLDGAVASTAYPSVAASYGNTFTEQRALEQGAAVVDLSHRGVITVAGVDRLGWLDSLLSQKLDALRPGDSAEALLLDPQGHVEYAMRIVDDGATAWLLVDEGVAPTLTGWLDRMRFMKQVEVSDVTAAFAAVGVFREGLAAHALAGLAEVSNGVPVVWHDPWTDVVAGGYQYAATEGHPAPLWDYREYVLPVAQLTLVAELVQKGDFSAAGLTAWDALRIAAWRPRAATEVDAGLLPHETDWLRTAVHLAKGCYRGQETVAKVHNLGHPPRRLVYLHLDGVHDVLPEAGAALMHEGNEVGRITAAARHFEEGPIALALIKRSVDPLALLEVEADGVVLTASQLTIVPTDAGRTAPPAKLPRLGAVTRD